MSEVLKANKGEWSEFYTLLKLLADQKLYSADEELNALRDLFYPILKIITAKDSDKEKAYELDGSDTIKIINSQTGNITSIKRSTIAARVKEIFMAIKNGRESSFEIPIAEEILINLERPVIKGYSHKKSDIVVVLHDLKTNSKNELGYSIKSQIGGASTLLNAGNTTNFIYELINFKGAFEDINKIDSRSKVRDRIKAIYESGASLKFSDMESKIFEDNLAKTDSLLPSLVAEMVLTYYRHTAISVPDINKYLNESFVLLPGKKPSLGFYEFKIKHMLMNMALGGLTPGRPWDGLLDASGGYIIVKEDGEIVCYHIFNQDAFRNYLYKNTKLETASTSRYGFGSVYEESGKHYIKLNLQIRFTD
ncbi:MAG: HpaII family restriction endonuclease [Microgenomates group bacterium]